MGALDEPDICSGKGCRAAATHALLWNNPKIHTPERRKAWLACPDHLESLQSFLGSRGLIRDVVEHEKGADHTV